MIPFCDSLAVTAHRDRQTELRLACRSICQDAGFRITDEASWRVEGLGAGGVVRVGRFGQVVRVTASGQALARLRAAKLIDDFLMMLGNGGHRVTGADFTLDIRGDGVDGAKHVNRILRKGRAGKVSLTEKAIRPADVLEIFSMRESDGALTGTVYLGKKGRHEVWAKVYDKQHQYIQSFRMPDPGPWVRTEIGVSGQTRVSLWDVHSPAACFWHYASPSLLKAPSGVVPFVPSCEGFTLEKAPDRLPAEVLKACIERGDVDACLVQLLRMPDTEIALDYLRGLLGQRLSTLLAAKNKH